MLRAVAIGLYTLSTRIPLVREIAFSVRRAYRRRAGKPPIAMGAAVRELSSIQNRQMYESLVALNAIDTVAAITTGFYKRLGIAPADCAITRVLTRSREALASTVDAERAATDPSLIVRFEAAWRLYQNQETDEALRQFEALFTDDNLLFLAETNALGREALVRIGEILGRQAERAGNSDQAVRIYERVLMRAASGVIARRLSLILWRAGRIRDAAVWSEMALLSDANLASEHLSANPHLKRIGEQAAKEAAP
jgi:hypothetical protein